MPENWTIKNLLEKHASRPYNPDIANSLFRSGYIESWGRGTIKILKECITAGIPEPIFRSNTNEFSVEFRKDIFNNDYLRNLNLNDRQVNGILFAKEKIKITNSQYQRLNNCSRNTASNELAELVEKALLLPSGQKGAGAFYTLNNHKIIAQ